MSLQPMNQRVGPSYPNITEEAKVILGDGAEGKISALTRLFNEVSLEAANPQVEGEAPSSAKWQNKLLDENLRAIDKVFQQTRGDKGAVEVEKRELLNKLSDGACRPALVSICDSFLVNSRDLSSGGVVSQLIRDLKRHVIQEIITANSIIRNNFIHTINAMNLLIKERREDLGIGEEDILYKSALADTYTGGVRVRISDELAGNVEPFFDALVDKFHSTYTAEALVDYAQDWINQLERKPLREKLAASLNEQIASREDDPSAYVMEVCLEKENPQECLFTKAGVKLLFEEEIKGMTETISHVEARVKADGLALKDLSDKWKASERVVSAAVAQNPKALQYADKAIARLLVQKEPALFEHLPADMKGERALVLDLVKHNAKVLSYIPVDMKEDKDFILSAVGLYPEALGYVPEAMVNNIEFKKNLINAYAIGKDKWEKFLGSVEDAPPISDEMAELLFSSCPFFEGKKVWETHMLVYIPKSVNGKGLTLNRLEELISNIKDGSGGHPAEFEYIWDPINTTHGDKGVEQGYWELMTKDVIPGSRNKSYLEQKDLVNKAEKWEVPSLLPASVSILMERICRGRYLFTQDPSTYTRTQEAVERYQLRVGGFAPAGLNANFNYFNDTIIGVAGSRKFF